MEESSEEILVQENGIYVANGSMKVNGNLDVQGQMQAQQLKIREDNQTILSSVGSMVSFRKECLFTKPVQFNNGATTIGKETKYNSAYVGSDTFQAGQRVIVGNSLFKIEAEDRSIVADTFTMSLKKLAADNTISKKISSELVQAESAKVAQELIANEIFADKIKTNKLYIEALSCLSLTASQQLLAKDLVVSGTTLLQNDLIIQGKTSSNGAALTVNGGSIIANKGIISHTRKNEFHCLEIMGSGTDHDTCLTVDKGADSLFQGNVTIQDSNLVLDNSKLVTDNIIVTQLGEDGDEAATNSNGVQLTTQSNWESYKQNLVQEVPTGEAATPQYDPYATVEEAMDRNESNYRDAGISVKTILNPINYLMEQNNTNVPRQFTVGNGIYRLDSNGNALLKNIVSQKANFSELSAFKFNVNRLHVDKIVTTSVTSKVVHTDNVLKSEGIAEFDGSINSSADVFIEDGSKVNIAENASVTFQNGSSLVMRNGAKLEMGASTKMKMSGDIEIDLENLVFLDSKTGRRYKISFRDATPLEGCGVVMDYKRVEDAEPTSDEIVEETELDSRELDSKLKSLGI